MKVSTKAFAGLLALALNLVLSPCGNSAGSTNGFLFRQNFSYHGLIVTRITPQGARIDTKTLSIYVQPDSTAWIYNNANKTFCRLSRQLWLDKYSVGTAVGGAVADGKTPNVSKAGQKCVHYWCGCFTKESRKTPRFTYEVLSCKTLPLPPKMVDEMATLCGLPTGNGMPLHIVRHYGVPGHGVRRIFLDTYSVLPAYISAAELKRPTGYKEVQDDVEVIMAEDLDEISNLLREDEASKTAKPGSRRR